MDDAARSDTARTLELLAQFVTTALPALEEAGVMHLFLLEVNSQVGLLSYRRREDERGRFDADRLLGLSFAIEAAQAGVYQARRALDYVERHLPELREVVGEIDQLVAADPSAQADGAAAS